MGWDGEENYKKGYIEVFIQIKRREHDMTTWRHYKGALEATQRFKVGCPNVSFEEGEEDEEGAKSEESEGGDDDEEEE
jgi:hypothetical protein